jgi:hypothetical protein
MLMMGANGGILLHQNAAPLWKNGLDLADMKGNVRRYALAAGERAGPKACSSWDWTPQSRRIVARNDGQSHSFVASFTAFSRSEANSWTPENGDVGTMLFRRDEGCRHTWRMFSTDLRTD